MMFNLFKPKVRPVIQKLAKELVKAKPTRIGEVAVYYKIKKEEIRLFDTFIAMDNVTNNLQLCNEDQKLLRPFMLHLPLTPRKSTKQKLMELLENEPKN